MPIENRLTMKTTAQYIFELPLKVRDYEVDSQGIVNNANYLHYLEHTRHEFCDQAGVSFRQMQQEGIDPVVSRIEIAYLTPLRLGEKMLSCLRMERRGARFLFYQDIFNEEGKQVVKATVTIVETSQGRLTRGDRIAEAFASYLE